MGSTLTHLDSKCGSHHDRHNSYNKSCRAVVGMLILRRIKGIDVQVGINAQGRKSIDDCLSRLNLYRPLLETVLSAYGRMPDNRREILKSILHGPDGGGMAGFCCVKNPCNMDPMSFYQPFIYYLLASSSNILD